MRTTLTVSNIGGDRPREGWLKAVQDWRGVPCGCWACCILESERSLPPALDCYFREHELMPDPSAWQPIARARVILLGFRTVVPAWDKAFCKHPPRAGMFMKCTCTWTTPEGLMRADAKVVRTLVYRQHRISTAGSIRRHETGTYPVEPGAALWLDELNVRRSAEFEMWQCRLRQGSQARTPLPAMVWEWVGPFDQLAGTITVVPEVWEYDTGDVLDPLWELGIIATISDGVKAASAARGAVNGFFSVTGVQSAAIGKLVDMAPRLLRSTRDIFAEPGDRPIGQHRHRDGVRTYNPPVLAIDLTKAASASSTSMGYGPGIYAMTVQDSGEGIGTGTYDSYIAFTYEIARSGAGRCE